jgi:hypothetical protein
MLYLYHVHQMVKELREATRAAKRQKAQLQREKALKAMGKRSQVYTKAHYYANATASYKLIVWPINYLFRLFSILAACKLDIIGTLLVWLFVKLTEVHYNALLVVICCTHSRHQQPAAVAVLWTLTLLNSNSNSKQHQQQLQQCQTDC